MSAPLLLLIPEGVWAATLEVFAHYAALGVEAGCFWYGTRDQEKAVATLVGIPRQRNFPRYFEIEADDLARLTEVATASGLVAVAQLHTHPGDDVNMSPWDETRAISQKITSLVLPYYGRLPCPVKDVGIHRFEEGRWNRLSASSAAAALQFTTTLIYTR